MKKILLINILALLFGAVQLIGQCAGITVVAQANSTETCVGSSDASATATGVGGTVPYSYLWSDGQTTPTATNLTTGNYTVTVTDINNCTASTTIEIELNPEGVWIMTSSTPVNCFGGSDGTAYAGVMTGVPPYTWTWNDPNSQTTATAVGLTAGQYHVTVTDVNGCSNIAPATVESPTELVATTSSLNESCVGGGNGSSTASSSGGTGTVSFEWSNGLTTATISGLTAGTYTVTATDANGCTSVSAATISSNNPAVEITTSTIPVTCNGQNNGVATVNVTTGTAPYTYLWSDGQTTATATGLAPGNYSVIVTDANGCTQSSNSVSTVTITEPNSISITNNTVTNVTCNGANDGTASITATGGTGNLSYTWSNGANGSNINGLAAGNYTTTITDANGCTTTTTVTVTEPSALTATGSSTGVTTPGGNDGTATANPSGGTSPYTYMWSNGGTAQTISNLTGGTYTVTITDINGCTITTTVIVTTPQVLPITLTVSSTPANCNNGSDGTATVSASGGVAPYTYLWSNGQTTATATGLAPGNYTVTVTDANSSTETISVTVGSSGSNIVATASSSDETCVGSSDGHVSVSTSGGVGQMTFLWSNGATTSTVNGLPAGTYTITVTDENGCTATASTVIEISPEGVWVDVTPTHVLCFGANNGTASTSVTTGVAPYTYQWSNGQTTPTATGLAPGDYTVTVTDANGCSNSYTTTINGPSSGSVITITPTTTNIDCFGNNNGTASVSVTGGTPGYTYMWSNGGTGTSISNLGPGTYTLTVTDNNGCTSTETVTITEPSEVTASGVGTNPTTTNGTDGSITLTVGGGTPGYTYLWSNGATTQNINGLSAGCYTVTVTDANACTTTSTTCLTDPNPVGVTVISTPTAGCNGTNTGTATATPTSGVAPYMYMWSNGGTTQTISNLPAGTYTVTVIDNNGSTGTSSVEVIETGNPNATASGTNTTCGLNNGSATANGSNGTPGYTYLWSNGETTQTINGLSTGTYTVTVTDMNGCTATASVTISETAPPVIIMTSGTDPSLPGGMNGFITANVTGGTLPYTYAWSNGGTTQTISGLSAGCYTVTVTDANSCTAESTTCINDPIPLIINVTTTPSNECTGTNNGTATVDVTTGVAPYTYLWSNGETTQSISGLAPGNYSVTVTDANGSEAIANFTIGTIGLPTVVGTGSSIDCGIPNGTASANAAGGTPGYTYLWSTGATDPSINGLAAGAYIVTVTDTNGCTAETTVNVVENSPAVNVSTTGTDPSTAGAMNGFVTATVSGGSPAFTYLWSNGGTTQTIDGLSPGCYTVTVTDANNCTAESTSCIVDPVPLNLSITSTPTVGCTGSDLGTATVNVLTGTPQYMYLWSNGGMTQTITGLPSDTYTVTVTDANGLTATSSVFVDATGLPSVTTSSTNINCGVGTNTATANPSGGTAGYTYLWSNNEVTPSISGMPAGTYTVTVTDANNCTATSSIVVAPGTPGVTVSTAGTNPTTPSATNGSVTATPGGGTPVFTYLWSTGGTTQTIDGLGIGCYTVTITDANNCTAESTSCIESEALEALTSQTPDNCTSGDDGTATINVTGGTMPYTYDWTPPVSTGPTATGLPAGTYTVLVTDANGITKEETIVVGQIDGPTAVANSTDISCNGMGDGILNASASNGGAIPYTYLWSTLNSDDTPIVNGQGVGTYTVTVTDDNGCTDVATTQITQEDPINIVEEIIPIDCNTGTTASITVDPMGGVSTYSYLWNTMEVTPTISNLMTGTYTVTVTDATGCTGTEEYTIDEPTPVDVDLGNDVLSCDGMETLTATTAAGNTVTWVDINNMPLGTGPSIDVNVPAGETMVIALVEGANGCEGADTILVTNNIVDVDVDINPAFFICEPNDTTQLEVINNDPNDILTYNWTPASAFSAGTNTATPTLVTTATGEIMVLVEIENQFGCMFEQMITVDLMNVLNPNLQDTVIACVGEEAFLNPLGNAAYEYNWSPASELTPNSNPTDVNPSTIATQTSIFNVTVSDPNSSVPCEVEREVLLFVPTPIELQTMPQDTMVECEEFGITLSSSDPNVDTYTWYNDPNLMNEIGTGSTLPTFSSAAPQYYYVLAQDTFGCTAVDSVFAGHTQIISALQEQVQACAGDTVNLQPGVTTNDPNEILTYTWTDINGMIMGMDPELNLDPATPGTYVVNVTNQYGCETTDTTTISLFELEPLISATANEDTILVGMESQLTAFGDEDYTYLWSNANTIVGGLETDSDPVVAPVETTNYEVLVTHPNGCTAITNTLVTVIDPTCDEPFLFFPNAFSPNDDGENDVLYLRGFNVDEVYFIIFNRWGQKVFESNSQSEGWDGMFNGAKVCNDVYGYYLRVKCTNGEEYIKKGNVTVFN